MSDTEVHSKSATSPTKMLFLASLCAVWSPFGCESRPCLLILALTTVLVLALVLSVDPVRSNKMPAVCAPCRPMVLLLVLFLGGGGGGGPVGTIPNESASC